MAGRTSFTPPRALGWGALALLVACSGQVTDAGPAPEAGPGTTTAMTGGGPSRGADERSSIPLGPPGPPPPGAADDVGPLSLRRLHRIEYNNTLADLLGVTSQPGDKFASDVLGAAGVAQGAPFSPGEVESLVETVDGIVDEYLAGKFKQDLACKPQENEAACAKGFIRTFGRRAYRHALSDREAADLEDVYTDGRTKLGLDLTGALGLVVKAALLSPRFHYHWGAADVAPRRAGGLVALDPYALASRLSYYLWQSAPDDALLDAAEAGKLTSREELAAQARRILADKARSLRGLGGFAASWLQLDALAGKAARDPEGGGIGADLYRSLHEATALHFTEIATTAGKGGFAELLAGRHAYVNETLAKIHGLRGVTGPALRKVPLEDDGRVGLFMQPGFLVATADTSLTTIIRRGKFVYERLATCGDVPFPDGQIPGPPARKPTDSVRQHLSAHAKQPLCAACHDRMDAAGFALDRFDRLGRLRKEDDYGKPLDTHGELAGFAQGPLRFRDGVDLFQQLAQNEESLRCFSEQVLQFALRTPLDRYGQASRKALADGFVKSGGDLRALLVDAALVNAFFYRKPAEGEPLP